MRLVSLRIAIVLVVLTLGIPLTLFPLKWARAIGWTLPEDARLTRYFGRCLGGVVLVLCGFAAWATMHPILLPAALGLTAAAMLMMVPIHLWGALERSQPTFETVEIALYLAGGLYFGYLALQ